jgi:maltoporin
MSFTTGRIGFGLLFALNSLAVLGQTPPTNELRETRQAVEQLKQEYDQMKQAYEERFKKLDERLKQLETANSGPTGVAYAAAVSAPKPATKVTVLATTPAAAGQEASGAEAQAGEVPVQFQEPTDSMQLSLAEQENNRVRERMERVMREYVDITGYFRAGYGRDNDGGPQVGFQAPGALAKGRLGNEAENYGEIAIGKNFYLPEAFSLNRSPRLDGSSSQPVARVLVRISMFNPYQNYGVASGTSFGIAEAWAAIGNLSSSQPSMNVWAGNRYYRRHDIHIDDFMMYNMSGGGGGVEDVKLPIGKLAFAWIGQGAQSGFNDLPQPDPANKAGFNKSNFDFRWYDVKFLGGNGEFGFDISHATSGHDQSGASAPDATGASITFIHTSEKWGGNENNLNKFYLQYGHGPAKTFTSGFETYNTAAGTFIRPDAPGSYRFRVADNVIFETGKHFTISPVLLYQLTEYKQYGGQQHWFSAGARPQAQFNNYLSLAFEPFVDWVDDKSTNVSDYLFKMTFAPQVSLGNHFMSRPAIRAFVTYAQWGNGFKGQVGGPDYANSTQGWTWGVQMESWW